MNFMYSIITPCYNSYKNLSSFLLSLKNQTYKNFEVIFVDDCSNDDTYESLLKYSNEGFFSMKVIQATKNGGPGASRNLGLKHATGKFILFVDSDDYLENATLETLNSKIEGTECLIFDYYWIHNKKKSMRSTVFNAEEGFLSTSDALKFSTGSVWCKCFLREILMKYLIQFPELIRCEDMAFNKIAISYCTNIYYIKRPLYYYVDNKDSIMNSLSNIRVDNELIAFKYLKKNIYGDYVNELNYLYSEEVVFGTLQNMILLNISINNFINLVNRLLDENSCWIDQLNRENYNTYHYIFLKNVIRRRVRILFLLVFFKKIFKKLF